MNNERTLQTTLLRKCIRWKTILSLVYLLNVIAPKKLSIKLMRNVYLCQSTQLRAGNVRSWTIGLHGRGSMLQLLLFSLISVFSSQSSLCQQTSESSILLHILYSLRTVLWSDYLQLLQHCYWRPDYIAVNKEYLRSRQLYFSTLRVTILSVTTTN